jgi:hypothetical protein
MIAHRFLSAAFIVGLFAPHAALALDWEIERNFRYFLYPSDMAAQGRARLCRAEGRDSDTRTTRKSHERRRILEDEAWRAWRPAKAVADRLAAR